MPGVDYVYPCAGFVHIPGQSSRLIQLEFLLQLGDWMRVAQAVEDLGPENEKIAGAKGLKVPKG